MEMNKMKRLVLLLIVLLGTTGVRAQLGEAVKKIFAGDSVTTVHNTPLNRDSDSVYVANLQKSKPPRSRSNSPAVSSSLSAPLMVVLPLSSISAISAMG